MQVKRLIDNFVQVFIGPQVPPIVHSSGVAKLGHTRARALASGGCAPPVQALLKIIGTECQSRIGR